MARSTDIHAASTRERGSPPVCFGDDPCRPRFLSLLDSDPDTARMQIGHFVLKTLSETRPPNMYRFFSPDEHPGLINEIYLHLVADDFATLRKYVNTGKPFAAWLFVISNNKAYDLARKLKRVDKTGREIDDDDIPLPSNGPPPDVEAGYRQLLARINELIERLDEFCQLLLRMAGDEYTIREMLLVLRLPARKNAWLSDKLRYCRKKLRRLCVQAGIT